MKIINSATVTFFAQATANALPAARLHHGLDLLTGPSRAGQRIDQFFGTGRLAGPQSRVSAFAQSLGVPAVMPDGLAPKGVMGLAVLVAAPFGVVSALVGCLAGALLGAYSGAGLRRGATQGAQSAIYAVLLAAACVGLGYAQVIALGGLLLKAGAVLLAQAATLVPKRKAKLPAGFLLAYGGGDRHGRDTQMGVLLRRAPDLLVAANRLHAYYKNSQRVGDWEKFWYPEIGDDYHLLMDCSLIPTTSRMTSVRGCIVAFRDSMAVDPGYGRNLRGWLVEMFGCDDTLESMRTSARNGDMFRITSTDLWSARVMPACRFFLTWRIREGIEDDVKYLVQTRNMAREMLKEDWIKYLFTGPEGRYIDSHGLRRALLNRNKRAQQSWQHEGPLLLDAPLA